MTLIHIAANNGDIGGGEVMLLQVAEAVRALGHAVHVIGPRAENGVVEAAALQGFSTTALAPGRKAYMRALASWDRGRDGVLWCNGLVPALATTGRPDRIVHLHQAPSRRHVAAGRLAALGSLALLVPSRSMARFFPTAQILPNWVSEVRVNRDVVEGTQKLVTLGFLGRPSMDKGVGVLAQALHLLDATFPGRFRLLLAGEPRFVDEADQTRLESILAPVDHLIDRPGWISRSDFFSAVDLAVFPSVWAEPFGLIVAEAMSARCPFVISDAGAMPEITGEDYPWRARRDSVSSLVRVLLRALGTPAQERDLLAEQQHARWERLYSPQAGRERVRHLLTDALPTEVETA
ncbi:MAG: glycosyltransferase family 4 protein [Actinomyces urogenitalis]|uniref:glycosyltransferase family 4 protein n=1 Tax=Actinomyces urogenitalis TaxID=103621 RepID=UPI002A82E196|nr:glycosyltransferase family 4 protein [Actinomyces urogenitalis]MDY3677861.1 glycosyltransferase family 4 protein [Actinomyces urogenitalis]